MKAGIDYAKCVIGRWKKHWIIWMKHWINTGSAYDPARGIQGRFREVINSYDDGSLID